MPPDSGGAATTSRRRFSAVQVVWLLRGFVAMNVCAMLIVGTLLARLYRAQLTIVGAYVIAIVFVLAWHALVIVCDFVIARAVRDPLPKELQVGAPGFLRIVAAEVLSSMRGVWIANPFQFAKPAPAPATQDKPYPLLFVHGYFCTRAVWHPLMSRAAALGYGVEALTFRSAFASIDDYAVEIGEAISDLTARYQAEKVVVIAHSMGGLAMRAYLAQSHDARVFHLITLGTPHHGTLLAGGSNAANARQMRRDSLWLEKLNQNSIEPRRLMTSVYSGHDNIVVPYTTSELEGANLQLLGGVGHVSLLYHRHVAALLFQILARLDKASAS